MNYKNLAKTLGFFIGIIGLLLEHDLHAKPKQLTADIIVIGGGTAGCALTSKLSEKHKVILLEAGTDQSNDPLITQPTNSPNLMTNVNTYFWELGHWVDTQTGVPRFLPAVAGKVLGGGSSVNGLFFVRSTVGYFSGIEAITGDSDWGPTNVFKVYNDIETFNGIPGQYNPAVHGFKGPLNIRQCALNTPAATLFANSAAIVTGVPVISDYNDPSTPNGAFVNWQITENPDQTRAQSFQAYLQGKLKRKSDNVYEGKNIILYTKARVEKILFSKDRTPVAKGVKAVINGTEYILQAKKKVIVAAGFQSPVLLQLSGIGPQAILNAANIDVIVNNANVGQNMLDHPVFAVSGTGPIPVDPNPNPNNLFTGGVFFPDPTQPGNPDRGFQCVGTVSPAAPNAFSIAIILLDAKSIETIGVFGSNPIRMPNIQFNYFSNPADLASGVAGYTLMYNTLIQMGLTPLGILPVPGDTVGIQNYILLGYAETYHYVGSCAMGTSAATAVVDSSGNVFGTKNLVVADITISPLNCLGNTQGIAYLFGNIIASKILNE
jgi:choline dehydrogenase